VIFTVAVLVVTAAVGFLALLTSWWVLGVVFGLHVLVTAIVGTAVFSVLSSSDPTLEGDNLAQVGGAASPEGTVHSRGRSTRASAVAA
jgi:membrane protein implicated in regulation of membrane protease activity